MTLQPRSSEPCAASRTAGSGAIALAAPRPLARVFGVPPSPQLDYAIRLFGARAVALGIGIGYLTSSTAARPHWQRIGLAVDATDTVQGLGHVVRRDLPLPTALAFVTLTGSYFAVGASRLAYDLSRWRTRGG